MDKVKGIDDYELGDYVENYPSGTYNLSIRQMMDGIPIYTDIGSRLSLDLASDKGKKGVRFFSRFLWAFSAFLRFWQTQYRPISQNTCRIPGSRCGEKSEAEVRF